MIALKLDYVLKLFNNNIERGDYIKFMDCWSEFIVRMYKRKNRRTWQNNYHKEMAEAQDELVKYHTYWSFTKDENLPILGVQYYIIENWFDEIAGDEA